MTLLQSQTLDKYESAKSPTQKDTKVFNHRHFFVLTLKMAGHYPTKEVPGKPSIRSLTGYSPAMIHRILADPDMIAMRQQILTEYDREFEDQYALVIEGVRKHLESDSLSDVEKGAKLWLGEHGKGQKSKTGDTYHITAEDVVFNMLKTVRSKE